MDRAALQSRRSLARESGQATVEWVGLVLGVALLLGAAAAGAREATRGEAADGLGEAVVQRITCAARTSPDTARTSPDAAIPSGCAGNSGRRPGAPSAGVTPAAGPPPSAGSPHPAASRPGYPRAGPPASALRSRARAAGVATGVVKRTWLLCLAYRRFQYEREHPRTPRQGVPVKDSIKLLNECLNPLSFLFG